jgi:hypothetical protein
MTPTVAHQHGNPRGRDVVLPDPSFDRPFCGCGGLVDPESRDPTQAIY